MKPSSLLSLGILVASLTFSIYGCASAQTVKLPVQPGTHSIDIAASNFRFDPNLIDISAPGTYTLVVTNRAGIHHNITVKDPSGRIIAQQGLPPGMTVRVPVDFAMAGTYPFLCTVDSHAELGMTGTFQVGTANQ